MNESTSSGFYRSKPFSEFTTIFIYPRRRADGGWCWFPVVRAKRGTLRVEMDGEKNNHEVWTYEQAKALGEQWAEAADLIVRREDLQ